MSKVNILVYKVRGGGGDENAILQFYYKKTYPNKNVKIFITIIAFCYIFDILTMEPKCYLCIARYASNVCPFY